MKTRIIHTKVWKDDWFVNLSQEAKFLWLYLLTSEDINISGVFELSDRQILFDTSIYTSILQKAKQELSPKAQFFEGYVYIPNVDKFNNYKNSPKNIVAFNREVALLPEKIIKKFGISDTSIDTSIDTPLNKESEIRNQKSKNKNHKYEYASKDGLV